ncbi:MAG: hypothetical protein RMK79_11595, partial [Anaerolineae bacterium]|nr:hypothetical protein [Anaerolineae bacterium]
DGSSHHRPGEYGLCLDTIYEELDVQSLMVERFEDPAAATCHRFPPGEFKIAMYVANQFAYQGTFVIESVE